MGQADDESRIKMLYITPEKYSKSEQLNRLLGRLAGVGLLSRFVIDEAHCLSQVGVVVVLFSFLVFLCKCSIYTLPYLLCLTYIHYMLY